MKEAADNTKEADKVTRYYLRVARYFLSTSILTGFGITMAN